VDAEKKHLVTFQGLRHTAASVMLSHGVSLIVVSRQLGHADAQITVTVYAHLLRDERLDEGGALRPPPLGAPPGALSRPEVVGAPVGAPEPGSERAGA
jgi:hypothetical protein